VGVVVVNDIRSLEDALASMEQWPGLPEGTRAIVSRRIEEDDHSETLLVLGYLRVGIACFPVTMLFDHHGVATGKTFRVGDFIDSFETFRKMPMEILNRKTERAN
jgi:hypothetical protein